MEPRARFEILFRAHCGHVRAFARRRMPSGAADEVVSEVFLIAWRRLDDAPDDALPWLFGIARGVIANRRRGDARREALYERLAATTVQEIDPGPDSGVRESPLLAALATLSEREREVLQLVAWEPGTSSIAGRRRRCSGSAPAPSGCGCIGRVAAFGAP